MAILRNPFLLIYYALAFHIHRVHSVGCEQIGTGTYQDSNDQWVKQLWPYTAGQGFDIVPAYSCYVRFQDPSNAPGTVTSRTNFWAAMQASRVTDATWTTTQDDFQNTCDNFFNSGNSNSKLWLLGGAKAFQYAGLLRRGYNLEPQSGLAKLNTVVTFLLPSGTRKVTAISSTANSNCQRLTYAGGIGISGTVDPQTDYAYTSAFAVAMGLAKRYPDPVNQAAFVLPWEVQNYAGPFTLAERADGNCVVIDFRNMPEYLLENNRNDAQVCNWQVTDPSQPPGSKRKRTFRA